MRFSFRTVFLLCVFLSYGLADQCNAQRSISVSWDMPENYPEARSQLNTLKNLGVSTIEINTLPGDRTWSAIDTLGFRVYGRIPVSFPLVSTVSEPDSALVNLIREYVTAYAAQASVSAIGLFQYGAVHKAAFDTSLQPFIRQIRETFEGSLYYTTVRSRPAPVDDLFDFKMLENRIAERFINEAEFTLADTIAGPIGGYLYAPENNFKNYLKPFKDFLDRVPEKESTVFVHSNWLFNMLEKHPELRNTITLYNSESEFVFPVPNEDVTDGANHSLIVLLLVLIWGLFAVNYHLSPVYRKSLVRYFNSHIFFVEDVMNRHIRSVGPAVIILIQNILLAGICSYSLGTMLFSPLGYEAIFHHYPFLLLFGNPPLTFFLAGCLFALILTLISIIWLRISNMSVSQTRQVVNLYALPLQINFLVVTLMAALLATGNRPVLLVLLALLFALIHISAFIIAAIDTSRYLKKQKVLFYTLSIALYCVIWIGSGIWLLSSRLPEVIQLALSLS